MIDPRVRYNTERIKSMFMELPAKKNVGDLKESDLKGKKVLVRTDFNVPLDANLNVTDDTKLINALPTLNYLINYGAKVIICSHLVSISLLFWVYFLIKFLIDEPYFTKITMILHGNEKHGLGAIIYSHSLKIKN